MPKRESHIGEDGYPTHPRDITPLAWFYEQPDGLCVCQQKAKGVDAAVVTIPWSKIERGADHHRKVKPARKAKR
jgi:hypothetical protein